MLNNKHCKEYLIWDKFKAESPENDRYALLVRCDGIRSGVRYKLMGFRFPTEGRSDGSGNGRTTQGHKKSLSPPEKGERERCGASDKGNGITAPCGPSCSVPPELSTGFRLSVPVGSPPEPSFFAARLSFWELQPPLPQGFPFRFRQSF